MDRTTCSFTVSSLEPAVAGCSRRRLLQSLAFSAGGLMLSEILRQRAQAGPVAADRRDAAVIFIQLGGGPSQFETYDPKPAAPAEYRGLAKPIATSVPGVHFCEWFPEQARRMDKLAIVRSVHHTEASHIALHMVETGYFLRNPGNSRAGEMPSMGSIVARCRGATGGGMPAYFSLPKPQAYSNPHYLGGRYAAFNVDGDPSARDFRIQNLVLDHRLTADRLDARRQLWQQLDRASLGTSGSSAAALEDFTRQAFELLLGARATQALDLGREPLPLRQRYGMNAFGQRLLLARRLVEADVPFVAVRTYDWDDHQKLFTLMAQRAPAFDSGIAALIDDLHDRGLQKNVLVVAMGEFGRSPRVNPKGGRDHWPGLMSVLFSGGGYRMGQVIGASDARGAAPASAPYRPESMLAMVYRHLGIDPATTFNDLTGRPRSVLESRDPVAELL